MKTFKSETCNFVTMFEIENLIHEEYGHLFDIFKDQTTNYDNFKNNKVLCIDVIGDLTGHQSYRVDSFKKTGSYDWLLQDIMNDLAKKLIISKGTYIIKE